MDIFSDQRVVLTLDAGGTNFVFNVFQGGGRPSQMGSERTPMLITGDNVTTAEAGIEYPNELEPKDISEMDRGEKEGNKEAALKAFALQHIEP